MRVDELEKITYTYKSSSYLLNGKTITLKKYRYLLSHGNVVGGNKIEESDGIDTIIKKIFYITNNGGYNKNGKKTKQKSLCDKQQVVR